jgi:hypothetical protein
MVMVGSFGSAHCARAHNARQMSAPVSDFYDDLASSYHLIFEDWDRTIAAGELSQAAIDRAKTEAAARGLDIRLSVCDMRQACAHHGTGFDLVVSCDNALPHLLTDQDIAAARYYAIGTDRLLALMQQVGFECNQRIDGLLHQPLLIGTRPGVANV